MNVTSDYWAVEDLFEDGCVLCRGGIAIWSANYPGNMAPVRAGVVSILGTPNRGTGARWALVDFLRTGNNNAPVTALSWSPCGRYPLLSCRVWSLSITVFNLTHLQICLLSGLGGLKTVEYVETCYHLDQSHNVSISFET